MSKILLISHIFPPAIDGGSKVVYKLGQYFESQNHQTLYLSSNCFSTDDFINPKSTKTDSSHQNFIKLPVYKHLRRPLKFLNLFIPKKSYLYGLLKVFQRGPIFKILPFIKTTIKIIQFKPDLIIAGPLPTTIIIYAHFFRFISKVLIHKNPKVLINASFHQSDQDFHQLPLIQSLQKSDYIWSLTKYETNYFAKQFDIDHKKIILAGNGVDENFLIKNTKISKHQKVNILFVGNLCAHKKVDLLIKSFDSLLDQNPTYRPKVYLNIIGQKTLFFPNINSIYEKTKFKKNISFHFHVFSSRDLIKKIDQSDFLILPSIQESFGLVIIESWARNKPVITTDIPPLKELVTSSQGGLTFKTNDQKDLQNKIKILIDNPQKRLILGNQGLNYVKNNYTWTKVGQKICQKISF